MCVCVCVCVWQGGVGATCASVSEREMERERERESVCVCTCVCVCLCVFVCDASCVLRGVLRGAHVCATMHGEDGWTLLAPACVFDYFKLFSANLGPTCFLSKNGFFGAPSGPELWSPASGVGVRRREPKDRRGVRGEGAQPPGRGSGGVAAPRQHLAPTVFDLFPTIFGYSRGRR